MTNKDKIISLSNEGYNYSEIANLVGVSRQYVSIVLGPRGMGFRTSGDFPMISVSTRSSGNGGMKTG